MEKIFLLACRVLVIIFASINLVAQVDYSGYISNATLQDIEKAGFEKCCICYSLKDDLNELCKVNCASAIPHIFCKTCILSNLSYWNKATCPICRRNLYSIDILLNSIKSNDIERVEQIIISGVDINVVNLSGHSPLIYACEWNRKTIAELLMHKGPNLNAQDRDGNTALVYSAMYNNLDIVESLLRMGAGVNIQNKVGDTALICAIKFGNLNMAKLLIELGNADINIKNLENNTALICAAKYNNLNMTKLLVEVGKADVSIINKSGDTALAYAQMHENFEIIELLV